MRAPIQISVNTALKTSYDEVAGACSTHGEMRTAYKVLVGSQKENTTQRS
jgi:hypothetical protein